MWMDRTLFELREELTNVEEVPIIHHVLNQSPARAGSVETLSPVKSETESFVLPCEEADALDNGRLDNLLAGEDTPGNSIRPLRGRIGLERAVLGHRVVSDVGVSLDTVDNVGIKSRVNKQL